MRTERARGGATAPRPSDRGFTFIETLIGLTILSIGVLALIELQYVVLKGNSASQKRLTAASLAEVRMNELRNVGYANIIAEAPTQVSSTNMPNATFTRQVIVANDTPVANSKTVTINVTWSDGSKTNTYSLASIITTPPPPP
jgi:prepilin-type N-terminal cleavage/methylation domain-containing protein